MPTFSDSDNPDLISFQPRPIQALVGRLNVGGRVVSSLTRIWEPGDTRRCFLCPTCRASHAHNVCAVLTTDDFGPDVESIPSFDLHGREVGS